MANSQNGAVQLVPCVIYIRVSTEEQARETHYSLEAQEEYCMDDIRKHQKEGWFHLQTLSDSISGGSFDRPGLLEAVRLAKSKKYGVLLIYARSRLARDQAMATQLEAVLNKHGVVIVSHTEGSFDSSPQSVFSRQMVDAVSELERALIRSRVRDALRHIAKQGFWKAGAPPFGYSYTVGSKILSIDPPEAAIVKAIFERIAGGVPIRILLADLRSQGIRSRASKKFKDEAGDPRQVFFTSTAIKAMIRLPIYRGKVRVVADPKADPLQTGRTSQWEEYDGKHVPIVDEVLWFQANRSLAAAEGSGRRASLPSTKVNSGMLQGLIRCECCSAAMSPSAARRRKKNGEPHVYYRCTQLVKGASESGCTTKQVSREAVDSVLLTMINLAASNSESFNRLGFDASDKERTNKIAALQSRLLEAEKEIATRTRSTKNLIKFIKEAGPERLAPDAHAEAEAEKEAIGKLESQRIQIEAALVRLSAKLPPLKDLSQSFGELARGFSIGTADSKWDLAHRVIEGIKIRRVGIPGVNNTIRPNARTFRMTVEFRTQELIQLGKPELSLAAFSARYANLALRVTFEIRSNAKQQTVMLLEHGYSSVSTTFQHLGADEKTTGLTKNDNPVQRAWRWQLLLADGSKKAANLAVEEKVSPGLISQHIGLLTLPQLMVDFLKEGRDAGMKKRFSLRELQRYLAMPESDALSAFTARVAGRPVQQTFEIGGEN